VVRSNPAGYSEAAFRKKVTHEITDWIFDVFFNGQATTCPHICTYVRRYTSIRAIGIEALTKNKAIAVGPAFVSKSEVG
jgi:hypothetical protein